MIEVSRNKRMETALNAKFTPVFLKIEDQSSQHAGHGGWREEGETHYHITIVSKRFEGQSRITRQRAVNNALAQEFEQGLHALALTTLAPDEYKS